MSISVETEGFGAVSHQQDSEDSTERRANALSVLVFFHYIFWQQKKKMYRLPFPVRWRLLWRLRATSPPEGCRICSQLERKWCLTVSTHRCFSQASCRANHTRASWWCRSAELLSIKLSLCSFYNFNFENCFSFIMYRYPSRHPGFNNKFQVRSSSRLSARWPH